MEEFEEAEKTKPKKAGGKQTSPIVTSPVQQSPTKQTPPTGITIVRNEQGQNVVLSVAGGIPGIVKTEQPVIPTKKSKGKGKIKETVPVDATEISPSALVKTEPSEMMSGVIPPQALTLPMNTKKQKQVKTEPVTPKGQESPPSPTKKGKSVIKMLLNTPAQFTTPTVSTTAISSDKQTEKASKKSPAMASPEKPKDTKKKDGVKTQLLTELQVAKTESGQTAPVRKILMSPSDIEDGSDDDEEDEDFDDEDDDDEGDDEEDMEWQFEHQDGTILNQDEIIKKGKGMCDYCGPVLK